MHAGTWEKSCRLSARRPLEKARRANPSAWVTGSDVKSSPNSSAFTLKNILRCQKAYANPHRRTFPAGWVLSAKLPKPARQRLLEHALAVFRDGANSSRSVRSYLTRCMRIYCSEEQ